MGPASSFAPAAAAGTFMPADFTGVTSGTGTPADAENQANIDAAKRQIEQQAANQQGEAWVLQNRLDQAAPDTPPAEVGPTIQQQVQVGQRIADLGQIFNNPADPNSPFAALNPPADVLSPPAAPPQIVQNPPSTFAPSPSTFTPGPAGPAQVVQNAPAAAQGAQPQGVGGADSPGGTGGVPPRVLPPGPPAVPQIPPSGGGQITVTSGQVAASPPTPAPTPAQAVTPAPAPTPQQQLQQLTGPQQQQIAALQSNLTNEWRQVFLNQGIQYPEGDPSWAQVQAIIQNQVNQLTAQAVQANTGQARAA